MRDDLLVFDLGFSCYKDADAIQRNIIRKRKSNSVPDCIILSELKGIFTIGRAGSRKNLLIDESLLAQHGIDIMDVDRGGDITYHGPGQIVAWPIIDLSRHKKDVAWFIDKLEDALIGCINASGINAKKINGLRGAWANDGKIASIGIGISKWITYHGLCINVNPNLEYFSFINPCGLKGIKVTSFYAELNKMADMDKVKSDFLNSLKNVLGYNNLAYAKSNRIVPEKIYC